MNPRNHSLFRRYPLSSQKQLSTGVVPIPYHVYAGMGLLIGGTASLAAVRDLLTSEQVSPIITTNNRALMAVWIFDFVDASLGPHRELQISLYVSRTPLEPVRPHPLALLHLLAFHDDVRQLAHGLWNNTSEVVAYNSELLGLGARLAEADIQAGDGHVTFRFTESESGQIIINGQVYVPDRPPINAVASLLQLFGIRGVLRFAIQPIISVQVMNRAGEVIKHNAEAQTYTSNDRQLLRFWDSSKDTIAFSDKSYQKLEFQPQFVQHINGVKFVYLNPYNTGDSSLQMK